MDKRQIMRHHSTNHQPRLLSRALRGSTHNHNSLHAPLRSVTPAHSCLTSVQHPPLWHHPTPCCYCPINQCATSLHHPKIPTTKHAVFCLSLFNKTSHIHCPFVGHHFHGLVPLYLYVLLCHCATLCFRLFPLWFVVWRW